MIDRDLPCASCAYDLRGLTEEAACPECGHPVRESLRVEWLLAWDPEWVNRFADLTFGLVNSVASACFQLAVFAWFLNSSIAFTLGVCWAIVLIATWRLTPGARGTLAGLSCGWAVGWLRGLSVLGAATAAVTLLPSDLAGFARVMPLASIAALIPYVCVVFSLLEAVALRTGSPQTAARAVTLGVVVPAAIVLHLGAYVLRHSLPGDMGHLALWVGRGAILAAGIWTGRVSKEFRTHLLERRHPPTDDPIFGGRQSMP